MIQDIAPHQFYNQYQPVPPDADSYVLWYDSAKVLCSLENDQFVLPRFSDLPDPDAVQWVYLFSVDNERFYWINQKECPLPEPFQLLPIFSLRSYEPRHYVYAGLVGFHLHNWYNRHRFCGRCGKPLVHDEKERMMRCPDCGMMQFPQICPAVIIGLTRGDKILLSKYRGRNYKDYALLAGFAEIGESIEETVRREVQEEVGLPVKNIRYYKSQPWPHSGSLLLGFFCELDGDDESIRLDEDELSMAVWMPREEIPMKADGVSLTNEMILWFKEHPEEF